MSENFPRRLVSTPWFKAAMAVLSVLCMAPGDCGGGGGGGGSPGDNYVVPDQTTQNLTAVQVGAIINQAANEAVLRGAPAIVAVVDRVGNVLGVARVDVTGVAFPDAGVTATCAAAPCATITSPDTTTGGLEKIHVPTAAAAISKAITGAYLSSGGNAFSTRTANQIIQENFPVGINFMPGGPLFGVQFSQLVCSDLSTISGTAAVDGGVTNGPHRSPLGLSADPGGMPLYMNGVLVGGIGVMSTASYSINTTRTLADSTDEAIALAGQIGFAPPPVIEASNISIGGTFLNYVGATIVASVPSVFGGGGVITPTVVPGFFRFNGGGANPPFYDGVKLGTPASGIVPDSTVGAPSYPGSNTYVLVDAANVPRYPPTVAGAALPSGDGAQITAAEAQVLVANALAVANQARAGIRIPTNSAAQVTVAVVDLDGNILAIGRSPDAPVFGTDVALQKARSAVFFSRSAGDPKNAFTEISALPGAAASSPSNGFAYYMNAQAVTVDTPPLFNRSIAFSELAIGALARPYMPDGDEGHGNGPLSLPFLAPGTAGQWSPFSDGLQIDLVKPDLATFLTAGAVPASGCGTNVGLPLNVSTERGSVGTAVGPGAVKVTQIANGLQIFSGGFPIYRGNNEIVGAIGISGDGILQDALIAYIGVQGDLANIAVAPVGTTLVGAETLFNAPAAFRPDSGLSDTTPGIAGVVSIPNPGGGTFTPRYVQCPQSPYITSRVASTCGS